MPANRIEVAQFDGLTPALDRKQVNKPFTADGNNFSFTAEGPRSAFSADFFSYDNIGPSLLIQTFEVDDEFFFFTPSAIWKRDTTNLIWIPVFVFPATYNSLFPWSRAFVGAKYYFLKQGSPIFEYNPFTTTWLELTTDVIPFPVQVTQAGGRLIILNTTSIQYSVIDDGSNLLPDEATGAGFQSLGIVGGGDPLGVREVSDGFITYTTEGTLHSQVVDSVVPFRHLPLSQRIFPINPFCIVDVEKRSHVVLTDTNFFQVRNRNPEIWQPLMGENFRRNLFPRYDPNSTGTYGLFYIDEREQFFASVSRSERPLEFDFAYVLELQLDKWGEFSRSHHQVIRLPPVDSTTGFATSGYTTSDTDIRIFLDLPRHEVFSSSAFQILNRGLVDFITHTSSGTTQFPTYFEIFNELALSISDLSPGLYTSQLRNFISLPTPFFIPTDADPTWFFSDDTGWTDPLDPGFAIDTVRFAVTFTFSHGFAVTETVLYSRQYIQPASSIDIGLFRVVDEEDIDRLNYLTEAKISMVDSGTDDTITDWNDPPVGVNDVFVDYDVPPPLSSGQVSGTDTVIDWGSGAISGISYLATGLATIDGYNVYFDETEPLTIEQESGRTRFYSTTLTGMFHLIRIETVAVNDNFHLKTMGVQLNIGGRLN